MNQGSSKITTRIYIAVLEFIAEEKNLCFHRFQIATQEHWVISDSHFTVFLLQFERSLF